MKQSLKFLIEQAQEMLGAHTGGPNEAEYRRKLKLAKQTVKLLDKKKPVAEFVDTKKEFKWRMVLGKEKSRWSKDYNGLLTHAFKDGRMFCLATAYWAGVLPIEKPFEIISK